MKVALCTINGRIAPKYYDDIELLIVTIHNGIITERKLIAAEALNPDELCTLILYLKMDVIICGGIIKSYQKKLQDYSVQLIFNVIGNVDDVLRRFMEGQLQSGDVVK